LNALFKKIAECEFTSIRYEHTHFTRTYSTRARFSHSFIQREERKEKEKED